MRVLQETVTKTLSLQPGPPPPASDVPCGLHIPSKGSRESACRCHQLTGQQRAAIVERNRKAIEGRWRGSTGTPPVLLSKCGFCLTYIEEGQIRVRLQSSDESQPHGAWHHIGCRASPAGKAKVINLDMLLTQDMMDVLGWRDHIDTSVAGCHGALRGYWEPADGLEGGLSCLCHHSIGLTHSAIALAAIARPGVHCRIHYLST